MHTAVPVPVSVLSAVIPTLCASGQLFWLANHVNSLTKALVDVQLMSLFIRSLFTDDELSRYSDRLPAGRPCFDSRQSQEIFLYSTASRPAHEPSV
jgi:hypothetical protein